MGSPLSLTDTGESSQVRIALGALVAEYGDGILSDPRRVRAMLADARPAAVAEINLIGLALAAGAPARLRAAGGHPAALSDELDSLARSLQADRALDGEAARWSVWACAWSMGLIEQGPVGDGSRGGQPAGEAGGYAVGGPAARSGDYDNGRDAATKAKLPAPSQDPAAGRPTRGGDLSMWVAGEERVFARGERVTVGRDPSSSIALSGRAISRRHAELNWQDAGWQLTDAGSTQGTFVNGARVDRFMITHGVDVVFGQGPEAVTARVTLIGEPSAPPQSPRAAPAAPARPLPVPNGGARPTPPAALPPSMAPPSPPPANGLRPGGALAMGPAPRTEVNDAGGPASDMVSVTLDGNTRTVGAGGVLRLGREEDNDLVLGKLSASRQHAVIAHEDGRWVLRDLQSSAGTWLAGKRVTTVPLSGTQEFVLGDPANGDTISVTAPGATPAPARKRLAVRASAGGVATLLRRHKSIALGVGAALVAAVLVVVSLSVFTGSKTTSSNTLAKATVRLVAGDFSGSGVIIDKERGLILTNAHVAAPSALGQGVARLRFADELDPNPKNIEVDVTTGLEHAAEPRFLATVVAVDGYLDIAVIKISQSLSGAEIEPGDLDGLTEAKLGNSGGARSGDSVTTIGYPAAADSSAPTLTRGVVSGITADRRLSSNRAKINIDARISPGNSGGLAANSKGQLIGVPTWGLPDASGQTVLSSIRPIDLAKPVIDAAKKGSKYTSPFVSGVGTPTVLRYAAAVPGAYGSIAAGCQSPSTASGRLAISISYKDFPAGPQTDLLSALYPYGKSTVNPANRVAVAYTTLSADYPQGLPSSGCATITFAPVGNSIPAGLYVLKVGLGGNLGVILRTGAITIS